MILIVPRVAKSRAHTKDIQLLPALPHIRYPIAAPSCKRLEDVHWTPAPMSQVMRQQHPDLKAGPFQARRHDPSDAHTETVTAKDNGHVGGEAGAQQAHRDEPRLLQALFKRHVVVGSWAGHSPPARDHQECSRALRRRWTQGSWARDHTPNRGRRGREDRTQQQILYTLYVCMISHRASTPCPGEVSPFSIL